MNHLKNISHAEKRSTQNEIILEIVMVKVEYEMYVQEFVFKIKTGIGK
ncbi:MAG: hypothetical protein H8E71_04010 [Candidatus Marinimicrobia bacterium]|nr:hypothetical protein [Candidatus Neomarinimicrobiota bacterium]